MRRLGVCIFVLGLLVAGCSLSANRARGVYVLIAVEESSGAALEEARTLVSYLLTVLQPNDTLGVARVDTGSFSEKDIIAAVTFDQRPSLAILQKRIVKEDLDEFVVTASGGRYADISGGILQAVEYLNSAGCQKKYILLFTDFKEARNRDFPQEVPFQLSGFTVIVLGPSPSGRSPHGPGAFPERAEMWRKKVISADGGWQVLQNRTDLAQIFDE